MATCSGKAYSERPASAETNTLNPYTKSPQEPSHEETSMDLGDDIEITTSPASDDEHSDLERAEGAALDISQSTDACIPPLEVEARTPVDGLIAENHHEVMTWRPFPADGADWRDGGPADGADSIECHPRSVDGADLTDHRPRSADGADLTNLRHHSASEGEVDNEYVNTESSQDGFLPAQCTTGKERPPNGHTIIRSDARYFKDWFSDHCPGLPTTPPDCISMQHAPTVTIRSFIRSTELGGET
ncbi:hypothetical protein JB92DRAFT_3134339 [Gautieria morchelliformis]|nr:hypothetical protein JB92DRAFT_3134339 [Gautieria morchelliformis]